MARLVIMLRVKDGIFFLKEWLERYESLADVIVALDNGSTDGTLEMLKAHPKVGSVVETQGYNEGRDKNLLYNEVRRFQPDWCWWLDVDEIIEPAFTRAKLDKMMNQKLVDRFAFRRFHFVDRHHFAASPYWLNYSAGHDRILWREKPEAYFADLLIDSPNVKGMTGIKAPTNYRIKHMGYINKALVDKKAEIYRPFLNDASILNTMYVADEKKVKWRDNRNSPGVILTNVLLNIILVGQYCRKAVRLLTNNLFVPLKNLKKKPAIQ